MQCLFISLYVLFIYLYILLRYQFSLSRLGVAPRNVRFSTREGGTKVNTEDILKRIGNVALEKTTQKIHTLADPLEKVAIRRVSLLKFTYYKIWYSHWMSSNPFVFHCLYLIRLHFVCRICSCCYGY